MGFKVKNGYKFSETAFGALLEREKKRESKFRHLVLIFGAIFGIPMLFLVLGMVWKVIKWGLSIT